MTGCRIGRVKLKSGCEIYKLPSPKRDETQRDMVERAAALSGYYEPDELAGYVVFGFGRDGTSSIAYFLSNAGLVGRRMLPSYVADALREKMIETGDWG